MAGQLLGRVARADCSPHRETRRQGRRAKACAAALSNRRSSPYSFQGHGRRWPEAFARSRRQLRLWWWISETIKGSQIALMLPYIDIFQVGARNMQNFNLLRELGKSPQARADQARHRGHFRRDAALGRIHHVRRNYDVILCERGIRTFQTYTRNTMDISAIPITQKLSHLPMTAGPIVTAPGFATRSRPWPAPHLAAGARCAVDKDSSQLLTKRFPTTRSRCILNSCSSSMDQLRMIAPAVGRTMG